MGTAYDFSVCKMDNEEVSLKDYQNDVLLIVNTASKCGFTPQFKELQSLYEKYQDKGLTVLGFPSDQFMNQEFDNDKEILEYCQLNYGVMFPMFSKIDVKGKHADPLFKFLTTEKKGLLGAEIKWNFTKFLVNRSGTVYKRFSPQTSPVKIEKEIVSLLDEKK
ncbi:glutathione peroxidase [Pseudalkalibacillus decolorationis]|uniref:glutathione peroxidase n=1 Tax=Pseudalkalibacillus decolorationis TaxID=163879 RepID=UPI002148BE18|nr:glutathione peroxidase [Pseudalkalibacillus decolorationis]